jgi:hypothetical protein
MEALEARGRIYVDFNEMVETDVVLVSKIDEPEDSSAQTVQLYMPGFGCTVHGRRE